MKKPTAFQALIAKLLGAAVAISTLGGVVLMWPDLRPWTPKEVHEAVFAKVCVNTISRYKEMKFQAQGNRAREEHQESPDFEIILGAREAEQFYDDLIDEEKRMCGFR